MCVRAVAVAGLASAGLSAAEAEAAAAVRSIDRSFVRSFRRSRSGEVCVYIFEIMFCFAFSRDKEFENEK